MNIPYSQTVFSQSQLFLGWVGSDFVFLGTLFLEENRVGNKRRPGDMVGMNMGLGLTLFLFIKQLYFGH